MKNNKRKFACTLAEGATHTGNINKKRKFAFTLAEVLVTLGVIGVVAVLTVPTLVSNYQAKSWGTAADVFEKKFTEAIKAMNVQGRLGRYGKYNTTEGFVEELQKHFKINKVCDNNSLMQCFEDTIIMNNDEIDMSTVKLASDFGQMDWNTNILGVQFANGVTGLIAYNPMCKSDPYNNKVDGLDCYALLYDTSGFSDPNELNKDLRKNASVLNIKRKSCAFTIDGVCYTSPVVSPAVSKSECEELKSKGELGITYCSVEMDYFIGAIKACGGRKNMMPTSALKKMSLKFYSNISSQNDWALTGDLNRDVAAQYGLNFNGQDVQVWTSDEITMDSKYQTTWIFQQNSAYFLGGYDKEDSVSTPLTICIGE